MTVEKDMAELDSMLESENDESMTTMLKDERVQLNGTKHSLMDAIIDSLMPMEIGRMSINITIAGSLPQYICVLRADYTTCLVLFCLSYFLVTLSQVITG